MKKLLSFFLLFVSGFILFATDQIATLDNGTKVILHDNGKWEYLYSQNTSDIKTKIAGTWRVDEEAFVEDVLGGMGIDKNNPQYAMAMSFYQSQADNLLPGMSDMSVTFTGKTCKLLMFGDETVAEYAIDTNRVVSLVANGNSLPIAVFNEDYTELLLVVGEGSVLTFIKQK